MDRNLKGIAKLCGDEDTNHIFLPACLGSQATTAASMAGEWLWDSPSWGCRRVQNTPGRGGFRPLQHHVRLTDLSRDLGGSDEGNSPVASFGLMCS